MTVLLTVQNPSVLAALSSARPGVRAMTIGPEVPSETFDEPLLCFVDWLLPDISGLEMVRRLREAKATRHGHITMVLERSDAEDSRRALRAGADDYLVGPLDVDKLAARLDLYGSTAAPAPTAPQSRLTHGELSVDLAAHQVRFRGQPVALRPNEFRLLAHFLINPDRVYSRTALISHLGKDEAAIDERTVDVWVGRLRRTLAAHGAANPLRTVRSLGYVLDSVES